MDTYVHTPRQTLIIRPHANASYPLEPQASPTTSWILLWRYVLPISSNTLCRDKYTVHQFKFLPKRASISTTLASIFTLARESEQNRAIGKLENDIRTHTHTHIINAAVIHQAIYTVIACVSTRVRIRLAATDSLTCVVHGSMSKEIYEYSNENQVVPISAMTRVHLGWKYWSKAGKPDIENGMKIMTANIFLLTVVLSDGWKEYHIRRSRQHLARSIYNYIFGTVGPPIW